MKKTCHYRKVLYTKLFYCHVQFDSLKSRRWSTLQRDDRQMHAKLPRLLPRGDTVLASSAVHQKSTKISYNSIYNTIARYNLYRYARSRLHSCADTWQSVSVTWAVTALTESQTPSIARVCDTPPSRPVQWRQTKVLRGNPKNMADIQIACYHGNVYKMCRGNDSLIWELKCVSFYPLFCNLYLVKKEGFVKRSMSGAFWELRCCND